MKHERLLWCFYFTSEQFVSSCWYLGVLWKARRSDPAKASHLLHSVTYKHRLVTFLRLGCGRSRPVSFRLMRTCLCRWAGQHVVVSAAVSRLISLSLCAHVFKWLFVSSKEGHCPLSQFDPNTRAPNFPGQTWEHFVFGEKNNNNNLCVNISLHILACLWLVGWCSVSCHSSKQDQRLEAQIPKCSSYCLFLAPLAFLPTFLLRILFMK